MYCPLGQMVHIKDPFLLIEKSNICYICYLNGPLLYVRRHMTVNKMYCVRRYIKHCLPSLELENGKLRDIGSNVHCLLHHRIIPIDLTVRDRFRPF